ncbi:unnamed protein product [Chrysoparadoxa australica]
MRDVVQSLQLHTTKLRSLGISGCELGTGVGASIAKWLGRTDTVSGNACRLTRLALSKNELLSFGGKQVAAGLKENKSLTWLDMACNPLGPGFGAHLGRALINSSLTYLDVSCTGLGDEGCAALLSDIAANRTLLQINLSHNEMRRRGTEALSNALMSQLGKGLTSLDLGSCAIGVVCIDIVAQAMPHCTSLKTLHLNDNALSYEGGMALTAFIAGSTSLRHLNVGHNGLPSDCVAAWQDALLTTSDSSVMRQALDLHIDLRGNPEVDTSLDVPDLWRSKKSLKYS